MKALLRRVINVANDRVTRVLFYDQTLKKGYASLAQFPKFFIFRRVLITLIAYPLSILCWIFLIVLNLFTPVQIFRFERPQRPGFASVYIAQLEPLCRGLQANNNKGILVFIDASEATNLELLKIYASHFNLYLDDRSTFIRTIFALSPKIGLKTYSLQYSVYDANWEQLPARNQRNSDFKVIPDALSDLGLKINNFVIVAYPSISYYKKRLLGTYSDLSRFQDQTNNLDAMRFLINKEFRLVRLGLDTDPLEPAFKELEVIDLSGSSHNDYNDLWLYKNCFFAWSMGGVGTWHFAHKFDRPSLITENYGHCYGYQANLYTRKLVWDKYQKRALTFSEMLTKGLDRRSTMEQRGLSFIDGTPLQICKAVEEMIAVATNTYNYSKEDLALLAKYDRISLSLHKPERKMRHSRLCISFLKEHEELLC